MTRAASTLLSVDLVDQDEARTLFGPRDKYLRLIRARFKVDVVSRGGQLRIRGDEAAAKEAVAAIESLLQELRATGELPAQIIEERLGSLEKKGPEPGAMPSVDGIRIKTAGQKRYVDAMEQNDVVLCVGPAGTGKTFLATVMAVRALKKGIVQRIVLCRPAVEAGEKLGYLPGDLQAKVDPYLRPLFDSLNDLLDFETQRRYFEKQVIEVAPLAYMRGRTLNRAFIVVDEAQNTTRAQMKMLLTRMGEGSKIVVTGDDTQIDLPNKKQSGLVHAVEILKGIDGISIQRLSTKDIVRHPIVWRIVHAYEGKPTDSRDEET